MDHQDTQVTLAGARPTDHAALAADAPAEAAPAPAEAPPAFTFLAADPATGGDAAACRLDGTC